MNDIEIAAAMKERQVLECRDADDIWRDDLRRLCELVQHTIRSSRRRR